jgi:metal-sulfur cluster biosynthetic enzyme
MTTLVALDDAAVRQVLDTIVDPCSRAAGAAAGISEMGMIPEIRFSQGNGNATDIAVRLIVTHPFCMMSNLFIKEIVERLEVVDGVGAVTVEFDPGQIWTPDLMTPGYAARLEDARARRRAEWAERAAAKATAKVAA